MKLNDGLIQKMREPGWYEFTVRREETEVTQPWSQFVPGIVNHVYERVDKIRLTRDLILDPRAQKELQEYFDQNHVTKIELDGKVIWEEYKSSRRPVIDIW